jgi:hypothetical protein
MLPYMKPSHLGYPLPDDIYESPRPGVARRLKNVSLRWSPLKLACFLLLIACGSTEPKGDLLFEGTIVDAATGAPISGTGVGVGDGLSIGFPPLVSTTDSQGRYTLSHDGCITSPYLYAYAQGYNWDSKQVGCKAERQTVNFSLTRAP